VADFNGALAIGRKAFSRLAKEFLTAENLPESLKLQSTQVKNN
jgi:hypothetical protein